MQPVKKHITFSLVAFAHRQQEASTLNIAEAMVASIQDAFSKRKLVKISLW